MQRAPLHPRLILLVHILGVALVSATWTAVFVLLPIVAIKKFGASEQQALYITASPLVLSVLSIFWSHLYNRMSTPVYLLVFWLMACAPAIAIGFAHSYWGLLIPFLIMGCGNPAWQPVNGDLLKRLYPGMKLGKIYGYVFFWSFFTGAVASFSMGKFLAKNPDAFFYIMCGAAMVQLIGVGLVLGIWRATGQTRELAPKRPGSIKQLIEPIAHMASVLKADPIFARYEGAYMTYGVGWMVCFALLPIIMAEKLKLNYDQASEAGHVPYTLALMLMVMPAGWLMDRIGAVRSTGISFLALALHPIGLIWAASEHQLILVSAIYGIAHAGAQVGWLLGPVSLAPSPDKVPAYVAIHATLVGVRGALFQVLGVWLYKLTGSFTPALVIAAMAYVWSAVQMWQLGRRMKAAARGS